MSIAAIAALFTTGAMAYDAQRTTGIIGLETDTLTFVAAEMNATNLATPGNNPIIAGTNQAGDALIYPAYYSENGWSTEFSVINTSSTEAVIAKVVLYSAIDSKEVRDFNIYLSANDVFRATIKDGKLTSTDSSTRASAQDTVSSANFVSTGYTRKDTAPMASEAAPFETTIDQPVGYFAVFAMAQTDALSPNTISVAGEEPLATYHHKHNELWQDYRHMLDQCRGEGWRTTANNYGGIFRTANMSVPNVEINGTNLITPSTNVFTGTAADCGLIGTMQYDKTAAKTIGNSGVQFKTPDNGIITGSVLVKGDDSKGTRSMLLPATAINNFTNVDNNVSLLWSEGEFANIADRCLVATTGANQTQYANSFEYNTTCLEADAALFNIATTNYEFRDAENTQILITQPYKRALVQIVDKQTVLPFATAVSHGDATFTTRAGYYNKNIVRAKDSTGAIQNVTDYGQFDLAGPAIYDDNENLSTGVSDGYIVSPAPIQLATPGIPNELSVFNPLGSYSDSKSGFAKVNYRANAHGIVTQMSADTVGSTSETNWIYPVTN